MEAQTETARGKAKFSAADSLAPFTVPRAEYMSKNHPGDHFLATGVLVFRGHTVLLIQRAESDTMPGQWEFPGGACDEDDESVLHGAARELMEETGLQATSFTRVVGDVQVFRSSHGKPITKLNFEAEVAGEDASVVLDPNEHQDYAWLTEDDISSGTMRGGSKFVLTHPDNKERILEAFRLRRAMQVNPN